MKVIYSLFIFSLILFTSDTVKAQITANNVTPDEAVALLVGPNVVYSNVAFTGDAVQLGYYSGAVGNFQIPSGIILSSDGAQDIVTGVGTTFINSPVGTYPDLLDIANSVPPLIGQSFSVSAVNDVAVLEFDFVASGPNLSFNYIFGSDEYLTYVNSAFNDVFAFFIAGPGITGVYSAPAGFPGGSANIAVVPNSVPELPITISSVNNVLNSAYYIDNPGQTDVALNGYTVTIAATSDLQCGETYHMKLGIADGTDDFLKSIVALQEGSFEVTGTFIEANVIDPSAVLGTTTLLEGCINGAIVIHPPTCIGDDASVILVTSGIAINNLDYTGIPASIVLNGEDIILPITTIADNINEGTESLIVSLIYTNIDNELDTATASLNLLDYIEPFVVIEDVYVCGPSASATPEITGGFGPYQYEWSSGQTSATATYSEGDAGDYSLEVTDFCGSIFDSTFQVIEPSPFVFDPDIDFCYGTFSGDVAEGGGMPYTFVYPSDSLTLVNYGFVSIFQGEYTVVVTDQCGSSGVVTLTSDICDTWIPNIFTPNGDGKNDMLHIYGLEGFPNSKLKIYNRWGNLIYEDNYYKNNWSGNDVADGVLYYIFERSDGVKHSGAIELLRGK